jgi:peptide/nickel transport system permease protein
VVLARVASAVGVLWGVATVTWVAVYLLPGDPAYAAMGGGMANPTPAMLQAVRVQFGFNRPWWAQYFSFLGKAVRLNFGESYTQKEPATRVILAQAPATVQLALAAGVLAVIIAVVVSLLTAHRRHKWARSTASTLELMTASLPTFWLGILLLIVFSYRFHLLPAIGNAGLSALVLPALALALPLGAVLTQVLRNVIEDVFDQPFVLSARARGMSDTYVRLRHVLRHALIPLSTMVGYIVASLLGGAVVTETLFSRQGLGRLLVESVQSKDMPVVLGEVVLAAAVYVTINLVVDLLYPVIDPRLRNWS